VWWHSGYHTLTPFNEVAVNPTEIRRQRADDTRMARNYAQTFGASVASDDLQPAIEQRALTGVTRRSELATWVRINRRAIIAVMQQRGR